jgi:hypothetical protein
LRWTISFAPHLGCARSPRTRRLRRN